MQLYPSHQTVVVSIGDEDYECCSVAQAADDLCAKSNNVIQWIRRITRTGDTALNYVTMFKTGAAKGIFLIPKDAKYQKILARRALMKMNKMIDNGKVEA
jgi:hypothetical protein